MTFINRVVTEFTFVNMPPLKYINTGRLVRLRVLIDMTRSLRGKVLPKFLHVKSLEKLITGNFDQFLHKKG